MKMAQTVGRKLNGNQLKISKFPAMLPTVCNFAGFQILLLICCLYSSTLLAHILKKITTVRSGSIQEVELENMQQATYHQFF